MGEFKKYLRGNTRTKKFDNGGEITKFSINIKDMLSGQNNRGHSIDEFADSDGWVNFEIGNKKEVDKYKNTHSVWLNEYKVDAESGNKSESPENQTEAPF